MKMCNEMLKKTLELTEAMVAIADQGDGAREDVGCGVLYGLLRDSGLQDQKSGRRGDRSPRQKRLVAFRRRSSETTAGRLGYIGS